METVTSRRIREQSRVKEHAATSRVDWLGIGIFALLIIATPLAFGGVDRFVQIALLAVFGVALALRPPQVLQLDRWTRIAVLALVALLVLKEFAPAEWFGKTHWRTVLADGYGLALPWTHHPEPGRAVDALLVGGMGALWFLWVRTLASTRGNRRALAWAMVFAAAAVALVSFATKGIDPKAIYGMRLTPGWTGFGPFPNRNHTASFLVMGALIGCGCVALAMWKKKPAVAICGSVLTGAAVAGFLATQSRGGFVAFALGLVVFVTLVVLKLRDARVTALAISAGLVFGAFAFGYGGPLLKRFTSEHGESSALQRMQIWQDTITLWKDAPLLGHGAGSFASVYPLYQTVESGELMVIHPESSWLQWLAEFGILPLLLVLVLAALTLRRSIASAFEQRSGFFLFAAAIGAAVALLAHSVIDVPSHRWGTAALGLAALALAFPGVRAGMAAPRHVGLLPLAVAGFWSLPLLGDYPAWAPLSADRLIARSTAGHVSIPELEKSVHWFPLNAKLHQLLGAQKLIMEGSASADWKRHFSIANRLRPRSSAVPSLQARLCGQFAPQYAMSYWQEAIERGEERRFEVFSRALQATMGRESDAAAWHAYVAARPELLLTHAAHLPDAEAREAFADWWAKRAFDKGISVHEVAMLYQLAPRMLAPDDFLDWMRTHSRLRNADYLRWASLLHGWDREGAAWKLLAEHVPQPKFPAKLPSASRSQLERTWADVPDDVVNAQALAQVLTESGDTTAAEQVILTSARRPKAPVWFRHKAAHVLAARGEFKEAVSLVVGDASKP